MGGLIGSFVDAFGGGDDSVNTENSTQTQRHISGYSPEAAAQLNGATQRNTVNAANVANSQMDSLNSSLTGNYNNANNNSTQINELFKNILTKFVSGNGNPTPDQIKSATDFVDQTFTPGAQTSYDRFLDQAQSRISNRAAGLGRSSTDSDYEREFAGAASSAAQDLANTRGSMIANQAQQIPLTQLQQLFQGANYFNTPLQQAIGNRLSLLNAATGQQQLGLNYGIQTGGHSLGSNGTQATPAASLGTRLGGIDSALTGGTTIAGKMAGSMGGGGSTTAGGGSGGGLPISGMLAGG